jgi:protoporphyrinogen oxidase
MNANHSASQRAIIIGAGPAGLTAAYELLTRSKIKPLVLERGDFIGGISRTIKYKGNRMDIGGHRFFSKSDRVMDWWIDMLPLQDLPSGRATVTYHRQNRSVEGSAKAPNPEIEDNVMLVRERKSRIYFMRKFFDYPISLSLQTLQNMGIFKTIKVGVSYCMSSLFPIKPERKLDDFLTNRFGRELYLTFFKSYTEKVWGVPCSEISAAWGAQRIKQLSLWKAVYHFIFKALRLKDLNQKDTETSLIERFLYPKFGPGQMWELVAEKVSTLGGELFLDQEVEKVEIDNNRVVAIEYRDLKSGERSRVAGDFYFSTMAIKDLVRAMVPSPPEEIRQLAEGLVYRNFITVGLLVAKLKITDKDQAGEKPVSDNWIYIQEPDVKLGRLQIFNNWSPYLVANQERVWLGLEYFCDESDAMWNWDESTMAAFAAAELEKIGVIEQADVLDSTVVKVPKTYPGYFGTYERFDELRAYLDKIENLFLVGRNGMHKYNNQDHSMLTAMTAVDNIINGVSSKDNLWSINMESDYHEEK